MEGMPEDMWTPFKYLNKVIEGTLANPNGASITELEMCLKKYKQNFTTILRNPPKNERSRKQLRNGILEGISVSGHSRTMPLAKDLVDESIIISDMFDLDEFIAMELLCSAQRQMPRHPGLPRGLVAILLYYDGRKAITCSLRDLFQVTSGVSWVTDVPKEVTYLVSSFTQCLVDDSNILERIIDLLEELDITKESVLLTKNRAFGSNKHQNQVLELFEDIRLALATSLFNWSAQRGLPKIIVVKLLQSVSKFKSNEPSGTIDDVILTMLMALLYSFDTSVLQRQEDNNVIVQNLPVMNEIDFAQHVYDALVSENTWKSKNRLDCIAKFAFGLYLSSLRHAPQNLQNSLSKVIERDEQLIDDAIANKIFDFIFYNVLEKKIIFKTEFFYRRIHILFTDFIDYMHSKITELRGKADETARTVISFTKEGLEPPSNLDHNFEMLMLCIGKFYKDNRANLSLCVEYWGPLDISSSYSKSTTRSVSLFKFIRLAGELLPPTLFVPYLKMIAGLTSCERSARNAFNLLKQASGLTGSATLSWEHFFGSLIRYYSNLRQEQSPGSDTIYRSRIFNRSINPQEIEGLRAVLEIIRAVATYDEIARVAICEHPNWAPLHVLLGLLSCSVPLALKADILKTLSALAKSKETAIPLWNNLEASQIITTVPTTNAFNICNLEMEIDQNECRIESYPLSQGVLELLHSLSSTIMPKNLGAGTRKPGMDPYITFIINGIFLKFYNRTYKTASEKWEVGEKCLKLIYHFLQVYEVNLQDFDEFHDQSPPPGYHVMQQLHTKSDMLRLILLIIDEARMKLDEYNKFHGKEILEQCALHCLNILESGLVKQNVFFDAHSIANSSTLLFGLNKILLDVNPRSRRPDHVLNTTKFITYCSWLPHHSLVAVKILNLISKLPNINTQILGVFTQNDRTQIEIRQGFVECLESELTMSAGNLEDSSNSHFKIELQIKNAVIDLLQECILQPAPNLSHFLLGFDTTKEMNDMHKLGAIDSGNNCTKSLISLLDNHLEMMKNAEGYDIDIEKMIERSYCLLFFLCGNQRTADTILRYLRSSNDFLFRHLKSLPFKNVDCSYVLNQISHLLKCTAIELKVTASHCQISRFQQLCNLLVGSSGKSSHDNISTELNHYYSHSCNIFAEVSLNKKPSEMASNLLLCHLLDCLIFEIKNVPTPKWEFFDNSLTSQILSECEIKSEQGHKLINVKRLNEILNDELRTVQSTIASGQRKLILQEIESILLYALKVNDERNKSFATVKLLEAWGQVSEILFSCAPETAIPTATKLDLILEIVQKILSKIVPVQPIFELSITASGTILLLLVNFRYYTQKQEHADPDFDNGIMSTAMEQQNNDLQVSSSKSNSLSLKFILKNILEWIVVSGVASQKLRINLYAALLNCLQIIKGNSLEKGYKGNEFYISRLDKTMEDNQIARNESSQVRTAIEIFLSFGDKLTDIICHDCISGHDICKMSALSCIGALLDLDSMSGFMNFISNRGYLSHIIESLMKSDADLCRVLSNSPENMKSIYVYESKMTMLLRLASCHLGAELLLADKIISVLSTMKVFDMHPDFQGSTYFRKDEPNDFVPTAGARYRQILFPALNLCDCLISTLGTENHSVVSQVMHFLLSHCDMIEIVLRTGTPFVELGLLEELAAITGLIARTTNQEMFLLPEPYSNPDIRVNLHRIQRLMLATFSRFIINEDTFKKMFKPENVLYEPTEINKASHLKYFLEISANLALYCRNVIANHSVDHRENNILFTPSVTELVQRNESVNTSLKIAQNLGLILNQLKGSVEYYNKQKSVTNSILRQKSCLPNISLDTTARSTYFELTQQYYAKQNELSLCAFITEHCLYLLWSHLDFYMRRAKISVNGSIVNNNLYVQENLFGLTSSDDINALRKNLILIFNETFCKQLLSTSRVDSDIEKGFNEALLRRIKSLIQFVPIN